MSIKCGKLTETLPVHKCPKHNNFKEIMEPMLFGLSNKEKRNLKFAWNTALDTAGKVMQKHAEFMTTDEIVKAIKELKE